jgi:hypothetical protein
MYADRATTCFICSTAVPALHLRGGLSHSVLLFFTADLEMPMLGSRFKSLAPIACLGVVAAMCPGPVQAQTTYNTASVFLNAIQNASTETFESRANGTTVVSWNYLGGTATLQGGDGVTSSFSYGGNAIGSKGYQSYFSLDPYVTFSSAVNAFGFYHIDTEHPLTVRVFRGAVSQSYSLAYGGGSGVQRFWGISFANNEITRVVLDQSSGDAILWDNMTVGVINTAVVPEPLSMILLGTGLAGVAAARRRRRLEVVSE